MTPVVIFIVDIFHTKPDASLQDIDNDNPECIDVDQEQTLFGGNSGQVGRAILPTSHIIVGRKDIWGPSLAGSSSSLPSLLRFHNNNI